MIVIDASLALELFLVTPRAASIEKRLDDAGRGLVAPEVIDLEILQTLRRLARDNRLPAFRVEAALDIFRHAPIERYSHRLLHARIWALKENLTAYDAAYFALAELIDAPLWTRDEKFRSVPGHGVRIEIL
ncbi:MAG: type II toxin-antitoxin system VapC family toxin [Pseudomonadota bacterium]